LRLEFNTADGVDHHDRIVHHTHGALDIKSKIGVTRGVHNIDFMLVPFDEIGRRRDGDTLFLLFRFIVHGGRTVINAAQPFIFPETYKRDSQREVLPVPPWPITARFLSILDSYFAMETPFNISTRSLKDLMKQVISNAGMFSLSDK